jgi:tetratricopeptide (TPR) repeat protein
MFRNVFVFVLAVSAAASLCSCSGGGLKSYIVSTRNDQGDMGLAHGNLQDASLAYRLALQLDPKDAHARAGLAEVQLRLAVQQYQSSKFEDALASLAVAAKYDPQSVRVAEIRSEIEQARVKREIVLSNYPTYSDTARQIQRAYRDLRALNLKIVGALQRFGYTYDSGQLTQAIQNSYLLGEEVNKNTNRLISFRQLVEAGAPGAAGAEPLAPAASLLPLP